ncbi:hypothetical protein B5K11_02570 [Rhizobium leguminosarum bv. trifolii]|uniref:hypothetical protein n=1 Tax=Rhizobium leguminosarum TaxID=384 RepID=UPI000E2FE41B|nr:hypothetical protein [Rhizobium leguminosarum]RFB99335.1 hypothetical protein B5K11_02570 [Rhizobium leguminosarum bv. trifolii]
MDWLTAFAKDDFGKAVITVAGTLIVTGFGVWLGAAKDIFTEWWKRRRQTRYHAMLLAVTLDQLIDDCIAVSFDEGYPGAEGVLHNTAPNPKIEWPAQLDWTLIPSDLMYRCLLLPGMIKSAAESASFIADNVAGPPDYEEYFEERQIRFSSIGLSAVHLLNRLKETYDVKYQDREHTDPQRDFEARIERAEKSREAERERQKKFMAEMHLRDSDVRYDLAWGRMEDN